jgi:hypothetical protein
VPRNVKTARVQLFAGLAKGDERLKSSSESSVDGLALIATSGTGVNVGKRPKTPSVPSLRIDQLDSKTKIKIDGKLDEEAWKTAPVTAFVDVTTGGAPKKSPVNGNLRVLWAKDGFYVAVEAVDKDVVGGFEKGKKDPHLWTKDAVEILVDPDGDNKDYYELQINPQNLVFDSQFDDYNQPVKEPDGPFGHEEWSSNLKSAVTIQGTLDKSDDEDQGYIVEAFVPWKSFGKVKPLPPAVGDTWRMNFYVMGSSAAVAWSPILKKGNFHRSSRFGQVLWATKDWTAPAAGAEVAKAPGAADSAEASAKPLPSGIVERLQAAKTTPAPAAPAPAAPAAAPAPAAPPPSK